MVGNDLRPVMNQTAVALAAADRMKPALNAGNQLKRTPIPCIPIPSKAAASIAVKATSVLINAAEIPHCKAANGSKPHHPLLA